MTKDLTESTTLITGATAGIGEATAVKLARLGTSVIAHGRNEERGAKVVQRIASEGYNVSTFGASVADKGGASKRNQLAGLPNQRARWSSRSC
jgi:NADP-dependent 3-hydroxy acid dehydrogenase YdfG